MGNNESKVGLDNDDARLTVSTVDGSVVGSKQKVLFAADVETIRLKTRGISETLDDFLDFVGSKLKRQRGLEYGMMMVMMIINTYAEARGLSPAAVTSSRIDGSTINTSIGKSFNVTCLSLNKLN